MEVNRWEFTQRLKGYLTMGLGAFISIVGLHVWIVQDRPGAPGVVLIGGLFGLLGIFATRIAGICAWLFKTDKRSYTLEFGSGDGVKVTIDGEQRGLEWGIFAPCYKTPNLLVLPFLKSADGLIIPKRCCEPGELELLRELLARRAKSA